MAGLRNDAIYWLTYCFEAEETFGGTSARIEIIHRGQGDKPCL